MDKIVFLILTPRPTPTSWIEEQLKLHPGIEIICHEHAQYAKKLPPSIPPETWNRITALLTWQLFPTRDQAPNLRYVQLSSAGANHALEKPLFKDGDITLCTANGVHPPQITEWVFATYLNFQHRLYEYMDLQKVQKWVAPESDEDTEDITGLRVGILGYGAIGRQCARVAKAFGMSVHVYTHRERTTRESKQDDTWTEAGLGDIDGDFPDRWFSGQDGLKEFLASGLDLFVITVPLTCATKGMIGKEQFELMSKRKPFFSNVGRGAVVDTDSLIQALDQGLVRGAALDVTDPEPLPRGHPLWSAKNVIITPHCSGNSTHYDERVLKIAAANLDRLIKGKPLLNQVDLKLGY